MIIIENLEQAKSALKHAGKNPVTLKTTPDAIYYLGSLYVLELFKKARAAYPTAQATFIFDCGDAGAEVIAAIRDGHKTIMSSAKPEIRAKLKAIAQENGVNFIENAG